MIDIQEIEKEIKKLEEKDTSYSTCEKLSVLYTVKDHYRPPKEEAHMSMMPSPSGMSNEIISPLTVK